MRKRARWEAKLEEEKRRLRNEHQRALHDLEVNVKDFVEQRREGRVTELELGEDGKMYAERRSRRAVTSRLPRQR